MTRPKIVARKPWRSPEEASLCLVADIGSRTSRIANNKMGVDVILLAFFRVSTKNSEQGIERLPAQLRAREPYGSEGWMRELAKINIVETNDGDVLGNAQARETDGSKSPYGTEIIRSKNRRGPLLQLQKTKHGQFAAVDLVVALYH